MASSSPRDMSKVDLEFLETHEITLKFQPDTLSLSAATRKMMEQMLKDLSTRVAEDMMTESAALQKAFELAIMVAKNTIQVDAKKAKDELLAIAYNASSLIDQAEISAKTAMDLNAKYQKEGMNDLLDLVDKKMELTVKQVEEARKNGKLVDDSAAKYLNEAIESIKQTNEDTTHDFNYKLAKYKSIAEDLKKTYDASTDKDNPYVKAMEDLYKKVQEDQNSFVKTAEKLADELKKSNENLETVKKEYTELKELAEKAARKVKTTKSLLGTGGSNKSGVVASAWSEAIVKQLTGKTKEDLEKQDSDLRARKEKRMNEIQNSEEYQNASGNMFKLFAIMMKGLNEKTEKDKNGKDTSILSKEFKNSLELSFAKSVDNMTSAIVGCFDKAFSTAEELMKSQSKINARLLGTELNYKTLAKAAKLLSLSPIVSELDYWSNVQKSVESGIAYNVEMRSFLETVKDDIASTFDAFDSTITSLVRVLQTDTTAARLGMEANYTQLFNSMFLDTSYLTSNTSDSVSSNLYEAMSIMDPLAAAEFESTVQTWLGSLYSLGMDNSAVTNIASALNLLATGDVKGLSGSSMLTLLAMSANRAGLDYASILQNGLTSDDTNDLLKAMVEYLAEIADEQLDTNKVVSSVYGEVLGGLSLTDLKAISNLTTEEVNKIYATNAENSYLQFLQEATLQVNSISERMSIEQKLQNIIDNVQYGTAMNLVANPALYAMYKAADISELFTGGFLIPGVTVVGSGTNLMNSVEGLLKLGVGGTSLLGSILSGLGGLNSANKNGLLSLFSDNYTSLTARMSGGTEGGSGFDLLSSGGESGSYAVNSNGEDITNQTLAENGASAKELSKTINGSEDYGESHEFEDLYKKLFGDAESDSYLVTIQADVARIAEAIASSSDSNPIERTANTLETLATYILPAGLESYANNFSYTYDSEGNKLGLNSLTNLAYNSDSNVNTTTTTTIFSNIETIANALSELSSLSSGNDTEGAAKALSINIASVGGNPIKSGELPTNIAKISDSDLVSSVDGLIYNFPVASANTSKSASDHLEAIASTVEDGTIKTKLAKTTVKLQDLFTGTTAAATGSSLTSTKGVTRANPAW